MIKPIQLQPEHRYEGNKLTLKPFPNLDGVVCAGVVLRTLKEKLVSVNLTQDSAQVPRSPERHGKEPHRFHVKSCQGRTPQILGMRMPGYRTRVWESRQESNTQKSKT